MNDQEMQNVRVGDTICDCRYRHLRVVEVREDRGLKRWVCEIVYFNLIPLKIGIKVAEFLDRFDCLTQVFDKSLILEDGANCSAIHCADVYPHPDWTHA